MKIFYVVLSALCLHSTVSYATPADAIRRLAEGNRHFASNHLVHPHQSVVRIKETSKKQHPIAAVLGCSDSRVVPEIIFDQGIGDLFVIREAGNVVDDDVLGSLEYAVEHLHLSLIIVLGHKSCGAVRAALDHEKAGHVRHLVERIEPALKGIKLSDTDHYDKAVKANIAHSVFEIAHSQPILAKKVQSGRLTVIGAIYDVDTGKVEFLQ